MSVTVAPNDTELLRDRRVAGALLAMATGSAALAGTSLLISQYVQTVVGLGPAAAGLWQAPTGLGIAAGVLLAPALTRRLAPATAITGGLVLAALGLLLLTWVPAGSPGPVAAAVALVALGIGPLFVLGTGLVVGSAPVERAGAAASLSETGNVPVLVRRRLT